ncbi:agmatinase [Malaciobacter pacificus]|uniref:Arginase/agmatinase/formiminoglutamate hydrolase, arginase family n=1 Tax=Malaciobacter pacificus TaxID=1080223 RepID=A0A5C2H6V8_9BACT|nr:agmatinase family protein [Malaciobacter pacificus]QEP34039.1 arginase/agmatinase/formiminoglutamate hydrolase, arginase family [Malaciobacter pacificus]GGD36050.1 agmatinase [Malaciobacter pacificus]
MSYRTLKEEIEVLELGLPPQEDDGFIGGRLDPQEAKLVLIPVPWEATVSFGEGTANAPDAIRTSSHQLDVETYHYIKPYTAGICMLNTDKELLKLSNKARKKAVKVIEALEKGKSDKKALQFVNDASNELNESVYEKAMDQITKGKFVGVVGGDHSSPLGLIKALNDTQIEKFGILHVDAHHDLREAYEGFTYSHASIFYNAMNECEDISNLVQIGIRDYSSEEANRMIEYGKKGACLYDTDMQAQLASGKSLEEVFAPYIEQLPQNVYLSIDIDGLEPLNCPNTGTPVPGGLRYSELEHLIFMVVKSGRNIIGFDLCEVGDSEDGWDANVGARVLYQLCGALLASQGKIEYK